MDLAKDREETIKVVKQGTVLRLIKITINDDLSKG